MKSDGAKPSAAEINRAIYGETSEGREDYWDKMAAPRFRVETLLGLLEEQGPSSAVDLGCGNGRLLSEIHGRRPEMELCGVDLSAAQMEANRARMPWCQWHVLDLSPRAEIPPALAGKFGAVIASELIEHLGDPASFLRNARALAAPDRGTLLLSTQSGPLRETERRVGHQRHFTRDQMKCLLESTGWEPVRVWNCGFPFHDFSKWLANLNPDASMRRFMERRYGALEEFMCWGLRMAFGLNSQSRGAQLFAVARRCGGS